MNFTDATSTVLRSKDPALDLHLADDYIRSWKKQGNAFVLPRDHSHLKPIVERYASDPDGFFKYVRAVRDEIAEARGMVSMEYKHLQKLVRTLDVRLTQAVRRERIRAAVDWLSKQQPWLTTDQRQQWARRTQQRWQKQRIQWLAAERKAAGGRLSEDLRADACAEFWRTVEEQINTGNLPLYE